MKGNPFNLLNHENLRSIIYATKEKFNSSKLMNGANATTAQPASACPDNNKNTLLSQPAPPSATAQIGVADYQHRRPVHEFSGPGNV